MAFQTFRKIEGQRLISVNFSELELSMIKFSLDTRVAQLQEVCKNKHTSKVNLPAFEKVCSDYIMLLERVSSILGSNESNQERRSPAQTNGRGQGDSIAR